jgi:hypothetical protein
MGTTDPTDSGIFRLASVGSYLDALATITDEMTLKERSNLIFLDRCLHELWGLGQNVILNWCPEGDGISLLLIPHYEVATYSSEALVATDITRPRQDFFQTLLSARRCLTPAQMGKVEKLLGIQKEHLQLREPLKNAPAQNEIIEKMIKRYSITYVPSRAVSLFDIVGFSLLTPFEQMMQLNSLSYSLNSAQAKLLTKRIGVDFSRTTTGDGFYIWNRNLSFEGNINLYHFMQLVLADNAIARKKAQHSNTVPHLRACFHMGSSYEFHQAEGLNPSLYNYIVGDVTVELARMIDRALPGQILVGEFHADVSSAPGSDMRTAIDSVHFVELAIRTVGQLAGLELSGERVDSIRCYLTGTRLNTGEFTVRRLVIHDKHGISRRVYNAKVNIYRENAEPILLGIEDRVLDPSAMPADGSEHLLQPAHA